MPNDYGPNTRTLEIPWIALVTRADPNWARDHRLQPELEPAGLPKKRQEVLVDWQRRGPYAP